MLVCSHALLITCSLLYLLWWSHAHKTTCFGDNTLICSHASMIVSAPMSRCFDDHMLTCLYAPTQICLDALMITCWHALMLSCSHILTCLPTHMSTRFNDRMLPCSHDWFLTCLDTHMFECSHTHALIITCSYAHMPWWSLAPMLTWFNDAPLNICIDGCMLSWSHALIFKYLISTHMYTWWCLYTWRLK